jgi:hypothetical protein
VDWPHKLLSYLTNNTVVALATVLSGIAAVAGVLTGFFKKVGQKAWSVLRRFRRQRPKGTLVFVQQSVMGNSMWSHGGIDNQDALQVSGDFLVTNISDPPRPIVISDVRIDIRNAPRGTKVHKPMPLLNIRGSGNAIPARATAKLTLIFFVTPRIRRPGESLIADIAVFDQFGTEHSVKKAEFESRV